MMTMSSQNTEVPFCAWDFNVFSFLLRKNEIAWLWGKGLGYYCLAKVLRPMSDVELELDIVCLRFLDSVLLSMFCNSTLFLKRNATFWKLPFGEECIPVNLGLYMQISHDPGSRDSDPGPQEKSMKKRCVSFEIECTWQRAYSVIEWAHCHHEVTFFTV